MKIVVGADHGGYGLKEKLKPFFIEKGIEVIDAGTNSEDSCDYPDIVKGASELFKNEGADLLVLSCGTGIGVSIAANKISGIYCALIYDIRTAKLAKSHNNVNCIALGGRELTPEVATDIVDTFLTTRASDSDRHQRRRDKVKGLS